jgi:uncharacterized protein
MGADKSQDRMAALPQADLAEFCRRWGIEHMAVFGSFLRPDFRPDSDLDFLVTFRPNVPVTLFGLAQAEDELSAIVGRRAELVLRRGIERSANRYRREAILSSAVTIYGQ